MPDSDRDRLGPSGRQLAAVAALWLAILATPLAGHLTQSGEHAHDPGNPLGGAADVVGSVPRAAPQQDAAQSPPEQREASGLAGVWVAGSDAGSHLISWGDRHANLLIMLFTGVLTWVGYEQWRLLRRSTEESAIAIEIARQTAAATNTVAAGTVATGVGTVALANATESALRHAREVAESELRPWVTISVAIDAVRVKKSRVWLEGAITVTNIGKTVAVAAKIGEGCLVWPGDTVQSRDATIQRVGSFPATSALNIIPQQERAVKLLTIGEFDPEKVGGAIFLTVAAAYGNGPARDYLTSETFMITMRDEASPKIRGGFIPDFSGGADDIHVDQMADMSVIR